MSLRDRNPCSDRQAPLTSFSPSADARAILAHAQGHGVTLRIDKDEQPGAHAIDVGGGIARRARAGP